jgi:hypothetical protein
LDRFLYREKNICQFFLTPLQQESLKESAATLFLLANLTEKQRNVAKMQLKIES